MTTPSLEQVEARGWTVAPPVAHRDGERLEANSATPLFHLIAMILQREGEPFADGFGGTQPVTAQLVTDVSGETLPAPSPPTPEQTAAITERTNETSLRAKLTQGLDVLEQATTGGAWGALTAPQKDTVLRLTVMAVVRLMRLALRKLDAAP